MDEGSEDGPAGDVGFMEQGVEVGKESVADVKGGAAAPGHFRPHTGVLVLQQGRSR